jgi:hypothetical protein
VSFFFLIYFKHVPLSMQYYMLWWFSFHFPHVITYVDLFACLLALFTLHLLHFTLHLLHFIHLFLLSYLSPCCSWSKSIDSINSLYSFLCLAISSCLLSCNLIGLLIRRLSKSLCSLVFMQLKRRRSFVWFSVFWVFCAFFWVVHQRLQFNP